MHIIYKKKSALTYKMDKATAYKKSKILAEELGITTARWVGTTKKYWNDTLKQYQRNLKNRNRQYNIALKKARLNREIIDTTLKGTDYDHWRKMVNKLRMRAKRRPKPKLPILEEIRQMDLKVREERKIYNMIEEGKFNKVMRRVLKGKTLDQRQASALWSKFLLGRYIMEMTNQNGETAIIALNSNTQTYFANLVMYGTDYKKVEEWGSDTMDKYDFNEITKIKISKYRKPEREFKNKSGGFFPYINNTTEDLSELQIYTQEQALNITKREHCLIKALDGVPESDLNKIKLAFATNSHISKKDLKQIANIINQDIILYYYDNDEEPRIRKTIYKSSSSLEPVEIAIYKNHYFKYQMTKYSAYSIKNYSELRQDPEFYNIYKKGKKNKYRGKINSLKLIHLLFLGGYFIRGDLSRFEEITAEIRDDIYLDRIDNEQRLIEYKTYDTKKRNIYYADCESFVYEPIHKLYLLGYVSDNNDMVNIMNTQEVPPEQIITRWMYDMTGGGKKDALCYFHNLKYDYHLLEEFLPIKNKCIKDNTLYSVKLIYKGKTIELRDSYKLLPFPLSKFGKNLNLPSHLRKKEAIAYEYYTPENNNQIINTKDYKKLLSINEQKIFDKAVRDCKSFYNDTFNPLTYYKDYLNLDCLVLKYGLQTFNDIILNITDNKLTIYDTLTISSLTDKYMKINGAYKGVYEVKDNLRAYIAKAVYGGRVCVNKKYQKKVIEGKISDYDGVSLYPSAINRLCREVGLPKGKAKRMTDFAKWEEYTYAIMTVKINKVNKKQQMPFIAYKTDTGTNYMNEPPPEPVIIDKITLEDYINFHHIEYEILDGVYWNEGGNKKMGELIQGLFKERLKHKKNNPALANTLKLMLNSAYGKTIMKKSKSETKIIKNAKFEDYIYNNFHTIKKYRKINDYCYELERTKYDDSYNTGQVGAFILSYSKRIMNEVFNTANDCNYPIYYTDTDSIHLNYDDVKPLEDKYRKIYSKELNGKNLEQFHIDFDLEGAAGEIYATKSIFLGKKSYIDYLESNDAKGNKIQGLHYRLKGITREGLEHTAKQYKGGHFELYEDLAKGTEKEMILNPFDEQKNKSKVLFEFKNGQVSTKKEFIRKVKF